MNNYDLNDDGMSDRLDYLADRHQDFFEWLDILWTIPDEIPDWELFLTEPSDEELRHMEEQAELMLSELRAEDENR
jgi:hypothetical protein